MVVRFRNDPVAKVAEAVSTCTPSTNKSNTVPLRLYVIVCHVLSKAIPPATIGLIVMPLPRALPRAAVGLPVRSLPIWKRLFSFMLFCTLRAAPALKSVPPLKNANIVKFTLSRVGITASFLNAYPATPSPRKQVPCSPASPRK